MHIIYLQKSRKHPVLTAFFLVRVSAKKNALLAYKWRNSAILNNVFVCLCVSAKKTPCLLKLNLNIIC